MLNRTLASLAQPPPMEEMPPMAGASAGLGYPVGVYPETGEPSSAASSSTYSQSYPPVSEPETPSFFGGWFGRKNENPELVRSEKLDSFDANPAPPTPASRTLLLGKLQGAPLLRSRGITTAAAAANVCETTLGRDEYVETLAPKASMISQRFVSPHSFEAIPLPNVPQALEVVNADHPHGMPEYETHGYSVLQQHILFFDFDNLSLGDLLSFFAGFRAVEFNLLVSLLAIVIINGAFSYPTLDSWIPPLLFPIYIKNIHKDKHGSDTGVYDTEGRFLPEKFEELFSKFDKSDKTRLHFDEILSLTNVNMNAYDLFRWTAAKLEWLFAYLLVKDDKGFVSKEHIRGIYDGSFFYTMAKLHHSKMQKPKEM